MNQKKLHFLCVIILFVLIASLSQYGCDIKEPTSPEWDITGNLPIMNRYYYIYDILKNSENINYDSTNGNVILTGSSKTTNQFGTDIKSDGVPLSTYNILSNYSVDTTLLISYDDSTQATYMTFLSGNLIINFFGTATGSYNVALTLEDLRSISDTSFKYAWNGVVPQNSQVPINIPLVNWVYKSKSGLSNNIAMKLRTTSSLPQMTTVTSQVTAYTVSKIIGRIKPTYIERQLDKVDSPFGPDVPEGIINFNGVDEPNTYLTVKRYTNLYQLDFEQVSVQGVNKNGNKVNLRYNPSGNPTINDTLFSVRLEQNKDSSVIYLTNSNSNIAEFLGNIPINIYVAKNVLINKPYSTGEVNYIDSFSVNSKFSVHLYFNVSQTNAFVQKDTTDFGISDSDQRDKIKNSQKLDVEIRLTNAIALAGLTKINVLDSFNVPLFSLSQIMGNAADSTISVNRAPVDINGFVNGTAQQTYSATIGKDVIDKLLRAGKVIYNTRFYTDQNPTAYVRLVRNDFARIVGLGKIQYRIKEN